MKKILFSFLLGLGISGATIALGATILFPTQGGTGLGTKPDNGQIMVGSTTGNYYLPPTSSLSFTDDTLKANKISTNLISVNQVVSGTSFSGDALPLQDDTYNLGSASLRWKNIYGSNFCLGSNCNPFATSTISGLNILPRPGANSSTLIWPSLEGPLYVGNTSTPMIANWAINSSNDLAVGGDMYVFGRGFFQTGFAMNTNAGVVFGSDHRNGMIAFDYFPSSSHHFIWNADTYSKTIELEDRFNWDQDYLTPDQPDPTLVVRSNLPRGVGVLQPNPTQTSTVQSIQLSYNSSSTAKHYLDSRQLTYWNYPIGGLLRTQSGGLTFAASNTASMYLADNGKVGIGTTTPAYKLDIYGGGFNVNGGSDIGIFRIGGTGNGAQYSAFGLYNNNDNHTFGQSYRQVAGNAHGLLYYFNNGSTYVNIMNLRENGDINLGGNLNENTGDGAYVNIIGGKVGIGTTNPTSTLSVLAAASTGNIFQVGTNTNQNILSVGANGTVSILSPLANPPSYPYNLLISDTASYATGVGGGLAFGGKYNSAGDIGGFAVIKSGKENATNGNYAGYLSFYSRPNGSTLTERMRIDSAGNVGIGTSAPNAALTVNGSYSQNNHFTIKTFGVNNVVQYTNYRPDVDSLYDTSKPVSAFTQGGDQFTFYSAPATAGSPVFAKLMIISTSSLYISNKVGIGTTTPTSKLHITGTNSSLTIEHNTNDVAGIILKQTSTATNNASPRIFFLRNNEASGNAIVRGPDGLSFNYGATPGSSSGSSGVAMTDTGNIGIGISTPGAQLQVHGQTGVNPSIWLSGSDFTHPFTAVGFNPEINSQVSGLFGQASRLGGGFAVNGFTSAAATNYTALNFVGYQGSTAPTAPNIAFYSFKTNGATGRAALADNEINSQWINGTTPIMTILGGGKVGIGTTTPDYQLTLFNSSTGLAPNLALQNNSNTGYTQMMYRNNNNYRWTTGIGGSSETSFSVANKFYFFDANAGAMRLAIDTSGNLGLGMTTPTYKLDLGNGGDIRLASSSYLRWSGGSTIREQNGNISITPTGNVGINTDTPAYKLSVQKSSSGGFDPLIAISQTATGNNDYAQLGLFTTGKTYSFGSSNKENTVWGANAAFLFDLTSSSMKWLVDGKGQMGVHNLVTNPASSSYWGNINYDLDVFGSMRAQSYYIGNTTTVPEVTYVGDSLTYGLTGTHPYNYYITLPNYNGVTMTSTNIGISGRTIRTMYDQAPYNLNPNYSLNSGMNIAVVWGGTNDLAGGYSASSTFGYLKEFCQKERSYGFKVVVMTMISRNGLDTQKNLYNDIIRSHWTEFADYFVDLGADANIGVDGAYNNTTYFNADKIHLTDTGYALVGGYVQTAINNLVNNPMSRFASTTFYGNVGIGTTTPFSPLTVMSSATGTYTGNAFSAFALNQATSSVNDFFTFGKGLGTNDRAHIDFGYYDVGSTSNTIRFGFRNNDDKFILDGNGNGTFSGGLSATLPSGDGNYVCYNSSTKQLYQNTSPCSLLGATSDDLGSAGQSDLQAQITALRAEIEALKTPWYIKLWIWIKTL